MSAKRGGLVVEGLTRRYRNTTVVDDVSFEVARGTVTGFVGPNGSGKSTTLRMIVAHVRPDSGEARFDGSSFVDLPTPGRDVGVLLDASAQHPGRTVLETAELAGILIGVSRSRVQDCLEAVGVESVARRRVGALSLGMRQRLGIAIATLGAPRYLILDEPANGLDPEGIHWLRQFLRRFAESGGTALVSSHQLGEIDAAADALVVIDRGRLVDGRMLGATTATTVVRSSDDALLASIIERAGAAVEFRAEGLCSGLDAASIGRLALDRGIALTHLAPAPSGLEAAFLEATHGEFAGLDEDGLLRLTTGGAG